MSCPSSVVENVDGVGQTCIFDNQNSAHGVPKSPLPQTAASQPSAYEMHPSHNWPAEKEPYSPSASMSPSEMASDYSHSPSPSADGASLPSPSSASTPRYTRRGGPDKIPRPRNSFLLFRSSFIAQRKISTAIERDHRHISRIAGECWQAMSEAAKEPWRTKAAEEKAEHALKYPDYRFKPVSSAIPKARRKVRRNGATDVIRSRAVAELILSGKEGDELETAVRNLDDTLPKNLTPEMPSYSRKTKRRKCTPPNSPMGLGSFEIPPFRSPILPPEELEIVRPSSYQPPPPMPYNHHRTQSDTSISSSSLMSEAPAYKSPDYPQYPPYAYADTPPPMPILPFNTQYYAEPTSPSYYQPEVSGNYYTPGDVSPLNLANNQLIPESHYQHNSAYQPAQSTSNPAQYYGAQSYSEQQYQLADAETAAQAQSGGWTWGDSDYPQGHYNPQGIPHSHFEGVAHTSPSYVEPPQFNHGHWSGQA